MSVFSAIDNRLFLLFNRDIANPLFDIFFPFITDANRIILFVLLLSTIYAIVAIKRGALRSVVIRQVIFCFILIGISDATFHRVVKPVFGRYRPTHSSYFDEEDNHKFLPGARFLVGRRDSLSFPSIHAASAAAVATYWYLLFPGTLLYIGTAAFLVGFSRIYVGVHYPFDVLGGFLFGSLLALAFYHLLKRWITFRDVEG